MKNFFKSKWGIMIIIILSFFFCSSLIAQAESINIKKRDSSDMEYVLLENGCLIKGINLDGSSWLNPKSQAKLIKEKVSDFNIEHIAISSFVTVLLEDGTLIKKVGTKEESVVDTDVSQMISQDLYLKNGTIYLNRWGNNYTYDNMYLIIDNEFALDNNDSLYKLSGNKAIKIADDVLTYKDGYIFNKNNEVLSFNLDESKGTVQLNLLTDKISYGNFCLNNYITNDDKYILLSNDQAKIIEGPKNVKKIIHADNINDCIYYISSDNKFMLYNKYYYNFPKTAKYGPNRELFDGKTFLYMSNYYALTENNELYQHSLGNSIKLIDNDVAKVLFDDSTTGPYVRRSILYQKFNGNIYYYNEEYDYPFIYPLAQKINNIIFNGKQITLEDNIQIKDGRSMYPFRAILEIMGAQVIWDAQKQKAIGILGGNRVEFKINTNEYIVNGITKYMDAQSYIDGLTNRTYIPIRYAAEALGFTVDWAPGNIENTITINKR